MPADTLAARLRELRMGRSLNQLTLGQLVGVKPPTISSWEKGDATPPAERIEAYARAFAGQRSVTEGRLLKAAEFTDDERADYDALHTELLNLRDQRSPTTPAAAPSTDDLWQFTDGAPIRLICGKLDDQPDLASGRSWNYVGLSAFADLDAMVQLYGHLREMNPGTDVKYKTPARLEGDDISSSHLIFVGNYGLQQSDLHAALPPLPVRQVTDPDIDDGEVFEIVETGRRLLPRYLGDGSNAPVVEDVGMFARFPNPLDNRRSITICSGVHTRGVYGAVRMLTDRRAREANTAYLRRRFADASGFGVLMRVFCTDHAVATPRLADGTLYEFVVT